LGLFTPAHEYRMDPPALPDLAQLRDQAGHGADERVRRLEDIARIDREARSRFVPACHLGRQLERLIRDADSAEQPQDAELQAIEPAPGLVPDPPDALVHAIGEGIAKRFAVLAQVDSDDVRLAGSDPQQPLTRPANEERRMWSLDRLRLSLELRNRVEAPVEARRSVAEQASHDRDRFKHSADSDRRRGEQTAARAGFRLAPDGPHG